MPRSRRRSSPFLPLAILAAAVIAATLGVFWFRGETPPEEPTLLAENAAAEPAGSGPAADGAADGGAPGEGEAAGDTTGDGAAALPEGRDAQTELDPAACQDVVRDTDEGGAGFVPTPSGPEGNTGECLDTGG